MDTPLVSCPKCESKLIRNGRTPGGKTRWRCQTGCDYSTTNPGSAVRERGGVSDQIGDREHDPETDTFLITWGQNATPVHEEFWAIMGQIEKHRSAEKYVIRGRYKNPTSRWTQSQANDEVWSPELTPFLWKQRLRINRNLTLIGDVPVQPTAAHPLRKFLSITGPSSTILAHPQIAMKTVAAPSNKMPKICVTTGAVTVANYTDSASGAAGKFHHTIGCLIVEREGNLFWFRHILYDKRTKSATDLGTRYTATGWGPAPRAAAGVTGDTHVGVHSKKVDDATFGPRGMMTDLNPEWWVAHDVFDYHSCNPHHNGDPIAAAAVHRGGVDLVLEETRGGFEFIRERTTGDRKTAVSQSNHHKFLDRWIKRADWKLDPRNALFYLKTAARMVEGASWGPGGVRQIDPLQAMLPEFVDPTNIKILGASDKLSIRGIVVDMHGHLGPGGSRGSAAGLADIGVKSFIGHSHGPCIVHGCWQVGDSTYNPLDYTEGAPSKALNAHGIIQDDGKRQMIFIIEGRYRRDRPSKFSAKGGKQ